MTTLQTVTRRTITLTHTMGKKPRKIGNILQKLGLSKNGNGKSAFSEKHDEILYR